MLIAKHQTPTSSLLDRSWSSDSDVSTTVDSEEETRLLAQAEPLLASYRKHPTAVNRGKLPSKPAVWSITEDLLRLVFPGFFHEPTAEPEFEVSVAKLWDSVSRRLEKEITKCMKTEITKWTPSSSEDIALKLMTSLPEVREQLMMDIQAAREGDPAAQSAEEIVIAYPCIETITVYRLANLLQRQEVAVMPRIMSEWAHSRTGVDIHPGATIGTHFFIDHGTSTVIGGTAIVGNHVRLYHGVTLGAKSLSLSSIDKLRQGGKRHPTVGDNVTIYLHATILGDIEIGAGSTINCCTLITTSIPADSMVLPNFPAGPDGGSIPITISDKNKHKGKK